MFNQATNTPDRELIGRKITDYYDSLSAEEEAELAEWGEFALRELLDAR